MRSTALFVGDVAHRKIIGALVTRLVADSLKRLADELKDKRYCGASSLIPMKAVWPYT